MADKCNGVRPSKFNDNYDKLLLLYQKDPLQLENLAEVGK
jgi:hypothetical protein